MRLLHIKRALIDVLSGKAHQIISYGIVAGDSSYIRNSDRLYFAKMKLILRFSHVERNSVKMKRALQQQENENETQKYKS